VAEPTLYLFDGYNLLHAGPFDDPRELVDRLASFVALHGARVFVMGNAFFKSPDYKRFTDGIRGQLASLSGP